MSAFNSIAGWIKTSFIDFPGTVSTVLFFQGCNLRCPYCHNPSIVNSVAPTLEYSTFIEYLTKRKSCIDGVVLSGGEPTLYNDLPEIVRDIKKLGLLVKLDSNGLLPDALHLINPDYLALDIKTVPRRYGELGFTSSDATVPILDSLKLVKEMGNQAEVRITAAPGFVTSEVIKEIGELIEGVYNVYIQKFSNENCLLDQFFSVNNSLPIELVTSWCDTLKNYVRNCTVRGY